MISRRLLLALIVSMISLSTCYRSLRIHGRPISALAARGSSRGPDTRRRPDYDSAGPRSRSSSMSTDEWRPREYRKSDLMRNNDAAFSTSSATPTDSRDNRESRDPQDSRDKAQGEAYEAFGRKQRAMQRKLGKAYRPREAKDTSKRDVAWKALIQKLDETKSDKERFGKDTEQYQSVRNQKNVPDELKCVHFEECSGCSLRGKFDDSPVIRRASAYFKSESIPFRVNMGQTTAWRTHVKLAVQPTSRWGGVKMGLYKEGTHIVEAIPECRVHHPR